MRLKTYFSWLWKASAGIRPQIILSAFLGSLHVGASLYFIAVCKHLVDIATGHSSGSLSLYVGLMAVCIFLQLFCSAFSDRICILTATRFTNNLRRSFFSHIMSSRWMGREQMHTGDMLNRLESDAAVVSDLLCSVLPSVWVTGVRLVAAFIFLLCLDCRLAAILFFIMPVALLVSKAYFRKMRGLTREIRTSDSKIQTHLQENLQHRTLIATLERTDSIVRSLDSLQSTLYCYVRRRTDFSLFSRTAVSFGFAAGYASAFLWGVYGLASGTATFGMLTAFLQLVGQVQRPMVDLAKKIPAFIHALISVERLSELSSLPLEEKGETILLQNVPGIRMENVTFAYPGGDRHIIENLTYDFAPGSLTAVVGETGAGKSTLMRLILALITPDKGRIVFYDGITMADASPSVRGNIVYVPQGNTLLSGSVRDNLLLGNPDASDAELRAALHTAAADFVLELPDGLDTSCGEYGLGFSEGQAQRIAIARGLLRSGRILLLDEPSSSLDKDTEHILLERLAGTMSGKTLILITHREEAAALCTGILRLNAVKKHCL